MNELNPGLSAYVEWTVEHSMTAAAYGSCLLPVFSTPMLVAIMECAACRVIENALPEGATSVGVEINVRHTAASPVGAVVRAEAVLTEVHGIKLSFEINASDESGPIGTAVHKRAIVDPARLMSRFEKNGSPEG